MTYGQGAAAALPIWAKYMKKVYDDPTLGYDQQEMCIRDRRFRQSAM